MRPLEVSSRLASNSRWNLIAFACTLIAHFVTVPFVIARIGLPAFGEAGLVIAAWAPLLLVGTVLGQASTRAMAEQLSRSAPAQAGAIAGSAIVMGAGASLMLGGLFVMVGPFLLSALTRSGSPTQTSVSLFLISYVGWAAQQGVLVLQSISAAQQNYKTITMVSAASAIALVTATVGFTSIWPSTGGYLAGMSASFCLNLLIWWAALRDDRRRLRIRWRLASEHVGGLLHFSKWQGLSQFAGAIGLQMDRYMLGALASHAVVGHYNVAMRLQEVVHMGLLKANEVLFPHFSITAQERIETRAAFFVTASWLTTAAAVCVLVPLIPLSWPLIAIWVDAETANGAAPILRVLAIAGVLGAGAHVFVYQAMATGQNRRLAALMLTHAMLTVTLTAATITIWGAAAAGFGILGANLLRLIAVNYLGGRTFPGSLTPLALTIGTAPPLLAGVLVGGFWWSSGLLAPTSWMSLGLSYLIVSSSVALVVAAFACLRRGDRQMLRLTLTTVWQMVSRRG